MKPKAEFIMVIYFRRERWATTSEAERDRGSRSPEGPAVCPGTASARDELHSTLLTEYSSDADFPQLAPGLR